MKDYLRFRDKIAEALNPHFHPIEFVDALIEQDIAKVFASAKAALLVHVRDYPGGARALEPLVAAGSVEAIAGPLRERAEEWARSVGCTHIIINSRPGWAGKLKKHGYVPHQLAVRKEL